MQHKKINKKKTKHFIINVLIIIVLLAIIINQTVWLKNMQGFYKHEFKTFIDLNVKDAVWMELSERSEIMGGFQLYSGNITNPNDTSRFITKKITTEDSIYFFLIDKYDPNTMHKISQFILKNHFPVDLNKLNTIFQTKITEKYDIENTFFDYIDLKNNSILSTNKPIYLANSHFLMTDTIPLDINNSIGVVGYVNIRNNAILKIMRNQLFFSILLIIITTICLILISRSFILQWKTEKMRQDSVNALTHEFKRPISAAVAMASTIPLYLRQNEIDKVLDYTQKIENELNKLTYYTKRIQQISNNEKENVQLNKTEIKIKPFFESLQQEYATENIDIKLNICTIKDTLNVDPLHFSNVMDNLIENSIKYNLHSFVKIELTVSDISDGLKISVKDNGIGISPMDQKLIFDKFYRIKRKETKNKIGFGLGLMYVKSIIEAHGGDIIVNSKLNEGSEFIITLKD